MNILDVLLLVYCTVGVLAVVMCPLFFVIDTPWQLRDLKAEGRAVLGFFFGLLWPLYVGYEFARLLQAIWRGVFQVVRFVTPRRIAGPVRLPKAQVRK